MKPKHIQHSSKVFQSRSSTYYLICILLLVICWTWQRNTTMDGETSQQLNGHSSPLHNAAIEQTRNMLENISLLSKSSGHIDGSDNPLRVESLDPALLPGDGTTTTTTTSQRRLIIIGDVHGCKATRVCCNTLLFIIRLTLDAHVAHDKWMHYWRSYHSHQSMITLSSQGILLTKALIVSG